MCFMFIHIKDESFYYLMLPTTDKKHGLVPKQRNTCWSGEFKVNLCDVRVCYVQFHNPKYASIITEFNC